ncbi:hypothetical protein FKM82_015480 [Ascaphus truei]
MPEAQADGVNYPRSQAERSADGYMCVTGVYVMSCSQVPLFVQIHQKWRKLYVGECQGPGVRTDFEMVHLRKVPNQYTHLSGLLDIFKSKIGCPLTSLPPVSIAIRFTYILQDWQQYFWPQQPPAPMTEDLLEEQSEVLAKLGTSAEGAHLRARMQSACLLSDMESFKGANPGCCLEDFVRWYSPRDYVEEEVVDEDGNNVIKGELSARMKIPNNMWAEAWETAKATPARRQRRLFDDTKEAEKVLHYLAVQKPADLTRHLLPCVIHAALLKVKEEEIVEDIPSLKKTIKHIISHSSKVLRFPNPDDKKLEDINNQIMNVEATIARARSLKAKFGIDRCDKADEKEDLEKFVSCLLEQPEVPIVGAGRGPAGCIIHKMFVNAQREEPKRSSSSDERRQVSGSDFPPPAGREVILRTSVPRPAPYSKALPQRMYSVLTKEDFRLAGAFSSDTTFF